MALNGLSYTTSDLTPYASTLQSTVGSALHNLGLEPEPTSLEPRLAKYLAAVQHLDGMIGTDAHVKGIASLSTSPRHPEPKVQLVFVNSDHEEAYYDPNTPWGKLSRQQRERILFKKRIDLLHTDKQPCTYSDLDRSFDEIVNEIEGSVNRGLTLSVQRKYAEPLLFQSMTLSAKSSMFHNRSEDHSNGRYELGCEVQNGDMKVGAMNSTDHFLGSFQINIPNYNISYKYARAEHHIPFDSLATRHQITYERDRSMIEFDHKETDTNLTRPTTTTSTQTTLSNTYHLTQNVHLGMKFKSETRYPTLQECVQKWSLSLAARIRFFHRILWNEQQQPYPATAKGEIYVELSSKGHIRTKIWRYLNDYSHIAAYLTINPWKQSPSGYEATTFSDKVDGGFSYTTQDLLETQQTYSLLAKTNGTLQGVVAGAFPGLASLAWKLSGSLNIFQLLKPSMGIEFVYNTEHRPGYDTCEFITPNGFSHYRLPIMDFNRYDPSLDFKNTVTRWHEQQMDMFWTPEQKRQYRIQERKRYLSAQDPNSTEVPPDIFLQHPEDQLQHCTAEQWNYIVHDDVFIQNHPVLSKLPYRIAKVYNGTDPKTNRIEFPSPLVLKRYAHRKVYPYAPDHKRGQVSKPTFRNDEIEHMHYWGWFVRKKDTELPTEIQDVLTNPTFRFWMSIYRFEYLQKSLREMGVVEMELQDLANQLAADSTQMNGSSSSVFLTGDRQDDQDDDPLHNDSGDILERPQTRKELLLRKTELDYQLENLRYQVASIQQAEMVAQLMNQQMDKAVEMIKKQFWAQKHNIDPSDKKAMAHYDELDLMTSPYYPESQYFKQLMDVNAEYQYFTENLVHKHGLYDQYNEYNHDKIEQWYQLGYNRDIENDPLNQHHFDRHLDSLSLPRSFKRRTMDELDRPSQYSSTKIRSQAQYYGLDELQPHGVLRLQNPDATSPIERYLGLPARYITHEQHMSQRAKVIKEIEAAVPQSVAYLDATIDRDPSEKPRAYLAEWRRSVLEPLRDVMIEGTLGIKSIFDAVSSVIPSSFSSQTKSTQHDPIEITVVQTDRRVRFQDGNEPNAALELLLSDSPDYPDPYNYHFEKHDNTKLRELMKNEGIFNTLNKYFFNASKGLFHKYDLHDPNHPSETNQHPVHRRTEYPQQQHRNVVDPRRHSPEEVESLKALHSRQYTPATTSQDWDSMSTEQKLTRMMQIDPTRTPHQSPEFTLDDQHSIAIDSIATEVPLTRQHIEYESAIYRQSQGIDHQYTRKQELNRLKQLRAAGTFSIDDLLAERAYRLNTRLLTQQSFAELEFKKERLNELYKEVDEKENKNELQEALENQILASEPDTKPYAIEFEAEMNGIDHKLKQLHDQLRALETKIRGYEERILELQIRALDNPSNIKYQDAYRRALKDREEILTYYNLERKDIEKMENELESQRVQVVFRFTHRNTLMSNVELEQHNRASQDRFKKALLQAELSEQMYKDEVFGMITEGKDKYIARHPIQFSDDFTMSAIFDAKNELLLNQRRQLEDLSDRELLHEFYDQLDEQMKVNMMFERPLRQDIEQVPVNTDLKHSPQINQFGQYDKDYSIEKLAFEQDIHRKHGYYPFHDADEKATKRLDKSIPYTLLGPTRSLDAHVESIIRRELTTYDPTGYAARRYKDEKDANAAKIEANYQARNIDPYLPKPELTPTSPLFTPAFSPPENLSDVIIDKHRTRTTHPLAPHHDDSKHLNSLSVALDKRRLLGVTSPDDDLILNQQDIDVEIPEPRTGHAVSPKTELTSLQFLTPQSKLPGSQLTTQQTIQMYKEFDQIADFFDLSESQLSQLKQNADFIFANQQRTQRERELELERIDKFRSAEAEMQHQKKKKELAEASALGHRIPLLESTGIITGIMQSPLQKERDLISKDLSYYLNTNATYDEFERKLKEQGKHPDQLFTTRMHTPQSVQPRHVWAENRRKLESPNYVFSRGFDNDEDHDPVGYRNNYINASMASKIEKQREGKSQDEIDRYLELERQHMSYGTQSNIPVQFSTNADPLFPESAHPAANDGGSDVIDRTAFTSRSRGAEARHEQFRRQLKDKQNQDLSGRLTDAMLFDRQRDVMGKLQHQHEVAMVQQYKREYRKLRQLEEEVAWENQFQTRYSDANSPSYQQTRDGFDAEMRKSAKERLQAQRRRLYGDSFAAGQDGYDDEGEFGDNDNDLLSKWSDKSTHKQLNVRLAVDPEDFPHPFEHVRVEDRVEKEEMDRMQDYVSDQNEKSRDALRQKTAKERAKKREIAETRAEVKQFTKDAKEQVEFNRGLPTYSNPIDEHQVMMAKRNKLLGKSSLYDEDGNRIVTDANVLPVERFGRPEEYMTDKREKEEKQRRLREKIFESEDSPIQLNPSFDGQPKDSSSKLKF